MEFLVPDYYSTFKCKASLCRNSCCEGWPVTFSMGDYFRLLSIDISPATKECLDREKTEHMDEEISGAHIIQRALPLSSTFFTSHY